MIQTSTHQTLTEVALLAEQLLNLLQHLVVTLLRHVMLQLHGRQLLSLERTQMSGEFRPAG